MKENIYREAYGIITTKTGDQMSEKELELVNRALFPAINLLPKFDLNRVETVSEALLRLAEMLEGKPKYGRAYWKFWDIQHYLRNCWLAKRFMCWNEYCMWRDM